MTGLYICRNLTLVKKDELAGDILSKSNNTFTPFLAIFLAQTSVFAQTPVLTLSLLGMYTNVNPQKATRLTQELFVKGQKHNKANSTS